MSFRTPEIEKIIHKITDVKIHDLPQEMLNDIKMITDHDKIHKMGNRLKEYYQNSNTNLIPVGQSMLYFPNDHIEKANAHHTSRSY